jgi:hypothetical protein
METGKRSVVAREWGQARTTRKGTEDFEGSPNTLYNTVMMHFPKLIDVQHQK